MASCFISRSSFALQHGKDKMRPIFGGDAVQCDLAQDAIGEIVFRGHTPIIVGGSGMYVNS